MVDFRLLEGARRGDCEDTIAILFSSDISKLPIQKLLLITLRAFCYVVVAVEMIPYQLRSKDHCQERSCDEASSTVRGKGSRDFMTR